MGGGSRSPRLSIAYEWSRIISDSFSNPPYMPIVFVSLVCRAMPDAELILGSDDVYISQQQLLSNQAIEVAGLTFISLT